MTWLGLKRGSDLIPNLCPFLGVRPGRLAGRRPTTRTLQAHASPVMDWWWHPAAEHTSRLFSAHRAPAPRTPDALFPVTCGIYGHAQDLRLQRGKASTPLPCQAQTSGPVIVFHQPPHSAAGFHLHVALNSSWGSGGSWASETSPRPTPCVPGRIGFHL